MPSVVCSTAGIQGLVVNYDAASWRRGVPPVVPDLTKGTKRAPQVVEVPTWKSGNFKFTVQELILNTSLILNS